MGAGHEALRKGRVSLAGQVYLVTFTTHAREPCFTNHAIAQDACRLILANPAWNQADLLAWVLMPDHWHGMIALGEASPLSGCIQRFKGSSSHALRALHPQLQRVWATGYHDHALRRDEDLLHVARYIVMNPVRAGLVESPRAYPFWDAVWI